MAIKDFFKAKVEPEPGAVPPRPEQILAWLEELSRIRTVLDLKFGQSELAPIACKVEKVGEETGSCTFSFQRKPTVEPVAGQAAHWCSPWTAGGSRRS